MAKFERKILSFSTTMRNPSRISAFLSTLKPYQNQILTHKIIMEIVKTIIQKRLYCPLQYLKTNSELNKKFYSDIEFSENELNQIINGSIQNHREKGFDKGWESRFDTWFKLMKEFGFCFYWKNKPILISQSGNMLIQACFDGENLLKENQRNDEIISNIFLNALSKYQVGNPLKKNLNKTAPFVLLIKTLKKLHGNDKNFKGIHRNEISIFLCWQNNDESALSKYITNLRNEIFDLTQINFGYTREFIYQKCLNLLESNNEIRFKIEQISDEAVDEYIRKMRITGLISLRGNGKFLDLNFNEIEKINYICSKHTPEFKNYTDDSLLNSFRFYRYMSCIDKNLITKSEILQSNDIKIRKLQEISINFDKEDIEKELLVLCKKSAKSNNDLFKLISEPLRFEFLTAIILCQTYENLEVLPNYKCDDEGIPISFAKGGMADIIATDKKSESLVEVSLITDRTQTTNEILPIRRHLLENIKNSTNSKSKFSLFIAPNIHEDSFEHAKFLKFKDKIDILCYSIADFIKQLDSSSEISELNNQKLLQ